MSAIPRSSSTESLKTSDSLRPEARGTIPGSGQKVSNMTRSMSPQAKKIETALLRLSEASNALEKQKTKLRAQMHKISQFHRPSQALMEQKKEISSQYRSLSHLSHKLYRQIKRTQSAYRKLLQTPQSQQQTDPTDSPLFRRRMPKHESSQKKPMERSPDLPKRTAQAHPPVISEKPTAGSPTQPPVRAWPRVLSARDVERQSRIAHGLPATEEPSEAAKVLGVRVQYIQGELGFSEKMKIHIQILERRGFSSGIARLGGFLLALLEPRGRITQINDENTRRAVSEALAKCSSKESLSDPGVAVRTLFRELYPLFQARAADSSFEGIQDRDTLSSLFSDILSLAKDIKLPIPNELLSDKDWDGVVDRIKLQYQADPNRTSW